MKPRRRAGREAGERAASPEPIDAFHMAVKEALTDSLASISSIIPGKTSRVSKYARRRSGILRLATVSYPWACMFATASSNAGVA